MKKVILFICLFIFATASISYALDTMWACYKDAFFEGNIFSHTCACTMDNDKQYCYAYHGSTMNSGEHYYTIGDWGYGYAWKFKKCATSPAECKVSWGVEGLCLQETNRMLYSSKLKVTDAKGYWLFYQDYGHYGNMSWRWNNCKTICKYDDTSDINNFFRFWRWFSDWFKNKYFS
ncbi:MAG: hypothetical protein LWX52_03810 [Deltaproteobacteria bacterium]|nr:hypothetical protein [Deltaproteobacteria bacterium]